MADSPSPPAGPGVDSRGVPVVDPTANVMLVLDAAVKRLDDMAAAQQRRVDDLVGAQLRRQDDLRSNNEAHIREIMTLTTKYEDILRVKEQERLDAIRAVDVQAVAVAQAAQQAAATALSQQVVATAEAARTANAAAAITNTNNLATLIEPLRTAIEDLRKTQYAQAGERSAQVESRGDTQAAQSAVIATAVAQALTPMQTQIAQLLAAQSVTQGQQQQGQATTATNQFLIPLILSTIFSLIGVGSLVITLLHG